MAKTEAVLTQGQTPRRQSWEGRSCLKPIPASRGPPNDAVLTETLEQMITRKAAALFSHLNWAPLES